MSTGSKNTSETVPRTETGVLISGVMVRTVPSVSAQAKKAAKIVASIKNVIEGNYITTLFRHVWGGNRMGDFCQEISK